LESYAKRQPLSGTTINRRSMILTVHDKKFIPYIEAAVISNRIKELAIAINSDYADKQPFFIAICLDESVKGRHVIIVEDIVDTGKTLTQFLPQLYEQQPASLKIAALLNKPEALVNPLVVDYAGFSVPNKFLLGFGLDYDGLGRNLPEIYQLAEE